METTLLMEGQDSMSGGTGDDTYKVTNSGDTVTDNSGEGTDTIFAEVSYTASDNGKNLYLYGSSNINDRKYVR